MRFFGLDELRPHVDLAALIDFMDARHRDPKGETADSLIGGSDARYLVRSATAARVYGTKLVTIVPSNPSRDLPSVQSQFVIFDRETGRCRAVMDATELTYWKTAADSGLGSRYLSRHDARVLLICGTGGLAPWLVRGHMAARPSLQRILVWNRTHDKARVFADLLCSEGTHATAMETLGEAVHLADIIATATMAPIPFLCGRWLRPGQHVDLVGSYGPDTREADDTCMTRAKVFTDCRETALHVGDILSPMVSGVFSADDIAGDLYDLANGKPGRITADDITLFKNAGGAHLDLMTAEFLLSRLNGNV